MSLHQIRFNIFTTIYVIVLPCFIPFQVFLIVALFNNIRTSMPGYFCTAIQTVAETKVSIRRIEVILLLWVFTFFILVNQHSNSGLSAT